MGLGEQLVENVDEIVQRWYEAWRRSPHPHHGVSETALKDDLPVQLRVIGRQLLELGEAESPSDLWQRAERLEPELRVAEGIPIEDLVLGYKLVVDVLRNWIHERSVDVSFAEYTYVYDALFELVAESVKRYSEHRAGEVSRERADYLAGISHQMRSPLSTLMLAVESLKRANGRIEAKLVDRIRRNVTRLKGLVDGVLRLERFKPHELPVASRPVEPARLIDDIVNDHLPEAERKGIEVEVHVDTSLGMSLDPALFRDVLDNLVDNAIKYTNAGRICIDAAEEQNEVLFRVIDSGPGIEPARRVRLFSPVRPQSPGGAGIGLTIARRAVVAQGGEIGVESQPGSGSCFWFRLPKRVPERTSA